MKKKPKGPGTAGAPCGGYAAAADVRTAGMPRGGGAFRHIRGEEVPRVISYEPFYRTLYKKNMTEYQLIFRHGVSANTLHRMKHGETITLKTLDTLCFILNCPVSDVIEYRRDAEDAE